MNNTLYKKLDAITENALHCGIAPSISLYVGFPRQSLATDIVIHKGQTHSSPITKTNDDTVYDLASLTKIIGTASAVAHAIENNLLTLDEMPFETWPDISIKTILFHKAGLPAHIHFYKQLNLKDGDPTNHEKIIKALWKIPTHKTDERLYSDLGFIALGFLLEKRFKKSLCDIFVEAWKSLGINSFLWSLKNSSQPMTEPSQIAQTYCHERKKYLRGHVHDANCHYLGGLAGHAGLFGTINMVKDFGQKLLDSYQSASTPLETVLGYFAKKGLAFDKPTPRGSNKFLSHEAFGHFGYTGVSLFVDPNFKEDGVIIALLTNRIANDNKPEGIFWLRSAIHQAVINS